MWTGWRLRACGSESRGATAYAVANSHVDGQVHACSRQTRHTTYAANLVVGLPNTVHTLLKCCAGCYNALRSPQAVVAEVHSHLLVQDRRGQRDPRKRPRARGAITARPRGKPHRPFSLARQSVPPGRAG